MHGRMQVSKPSETVQKASIHGLPRDTQPCHWRGKRTRVQEMERSFEPEILDGMMVTEKEAARSYRELTTLHRLLGNTRHLITSLQKDPLPVRRILDIGCARGDVLHEVCQALRVEGIGVDLVPRPTGAVPILKANAVHDCLPKVDVAYSTFVAHHLCELDLICMIRNVGRFSRRFILLDVVRSWIPLALFQVLVAPFVSSITAADGRTSIRRAYTPREFRTVVAHALSGTKA